MFAIENVADPTVLVLEKAGTTRVYYEGCLDVSPSSTGPSKELV
jgi:hypothetical protein